jgi:hypothetical protein
VCRFDDGRLQREEISDYSPERRSYRCVIEGGLPVRDNRGSFAVDAGDGDALVPVEATTR